MRISTFNQRDNSQKSVRNTKTRADSVNRKEGRKDREPTLRREN